jgi:hypothetical protein
MIIDDIENVRVRCASFCGVMGGENGGPARGGREKNGRKEEKKQGVDNIIALFALKMLICIKRE